MRLNRTLILVTIMIAATGFTAASPVELTITPQKPAVEVNSFQPYQVEVTNTGGKKDRYFASSQSREVKIRPVDFYLEAQETETVYVWYNPDTDRKPGTYTFPVTFESSLTGKRYTIEGSAKVVADHQVKVDVDPLSQTTCRNVKAQYEVSITNKGLQKEEFQLTTGYGELSQSSITLEDGETASVTLTASSDKAVTKNFNVIAASKTSYAQDIENVGFTAETCYASDVSITPRSQKIAAGTTGEYTVTVRNTGTRQDEFVLSASTGELEDTSLTVPADSSRTTTLRFSSKKLGEKQLEVTAKGRSTSTASATADVYNGMDVALGFDRQSRNVCEASSVTLEATVKNTGMAAETYSLEASTGNLSASEFKLQPNMTKNVEVQVNARNYEIGETHEVELTATSETFGEPVKSASTGFKVNNCWDLKMNVVPRIASAGENRSVIYEVQLENTGTRRNTYNISKDGPSWISIQPDQVTLRSGERGKAYLYAGIPFQKKGKISITVTGTGRDVRKTETVQLLVNEEIENAIRDSDNFMTGAFTEYLSGISKSIGTASNATKILISLLAGALITAFILLREW